MLIVEMTSKPVPVCPGCRFAVETEDGRVFCGNHDCVFFLQTTMCRCELRESSMFEKPETVESKEK